MRIGSMVVFLVLLVAAGEAAEVATLEATVAMPADLTGVWNLDTAASDDLAGQLEDLRAEMIARAEGSKPGIGYGGEEEGVGIRGRRDRSGSVGNMGDQGGNAGGKGAPRGAEPSGPRDLARAMEQLLITIDGADVEIMDGSDWTRIWTPGGKPVLRDGPGGEVVEQAWWDGAVLVLSTNGDALSIIRRLSLEDDGKTLVADVTVKVSGTPQRIDARLVYTGY